jgi:hypothetical protein
MNYIKPSIETTASCVDGENNQTWMQPLIDRTNEVNEETARIKAETARLKKEVSP